MIIFFFLENDLIKILNANFSLVSKIPQTRKSCCLCCHCLLIKVISYFFQKKTFLNDDNFFSKTNLFSKIYHNNSIVICTGRTLIQSIQNIHSSPPTLKRDSYRHNHLLIYLKIKYVNFYWDMMIEQQHKLHFSNTHNFSSFLCLTKLQISLNIYVLLGFI